MIPRIYSYILYFPTGNTSSLEHNDILQELARSLFVAEGGVSAISNTINNICKYHYLLIIRHPVILNTAAKRGNPAS